MDQSYVFFGHRGARYGVDVRAVREIVWLPELSPIEELPPYIAGVFNLRGRVVPVMDLGLRFGHPRECYLPGDRVIVINRDDTRVGLIANELHDVMVIPHACIEDVRSYQGAGGEAQFIFGEAKLDDGLAMLLDVDALLRSAPSEEALSIHAPPGSDEELWRVYGNRSPADAELFRGRARSLAEVLEAGERSGLEAFAVIRLEGELFGLGLAVVREFSHLRGVTPLPCSPPHIVGSMNLRGDILTLVDIRPALGMATEGAMSEVVVVRVGDLLFGVPVAAIVNVLHLASSDIAAVPVASDRAGKTHCRGVATVDGQAVGILNLEKILAAGELQVAEDVQ
jgi:purine-binding chemotaxis protein CheW